MENVLTQVSHFYGVPAWYCVSGIVCAFVVGLALAYILEQKPNLPQLLLFGLAVFVSGWLAPISWAAIICALKAIYDGYRTNRQ